MICTVELFYNLTPVQKRKGKFRLFETPIFKRQVLVKPGTLVPYGKPMQRTRAQSSKECSSTEGCFADDVVIIYLGKHLKTCRELAQHAKK